MIHPFLASCIVQKSVRKSKDPIIGKSSIVEKRSRNKQQESSDKVLGLRK